MQYHCPKPEDIADVRELNREFLSCLARQQHRGLQDLDRTDREALDRLAAAPFLLFELRAPDSGFWERTFTGVNDLLDRSLADSGQDAAQIASTLGFLWHLSRRDPHAARLFTGSSTDWCRQLAATPLIHVINSALGAGVSLRLRVNAADPRWRAMVRTAGGPDKASRIVAVMRVFQALLLSGEGESAVAKAACRLRSPSRRFAVRDSG